MLKKTPLASAISSITLATALAATSVAVPVFAADDENMIEEVVVTGSRIKRADFTSNAPVATIGSDQIDITGTINTESLLNTMPQMVPVLTALQTTQVTALLPLTFVVWAQAEH